jgi:hypothetical protein
LSEYQDKTFFSRLSYLLLAVQIQQQQQKEKKKNKAVLIREMNEASTS